MFRQIAKKLSEKTSLAGLAMLFGAIATGTWADPVAIAQALSGIALIAAPEGARHE